MMASYAALLGLWSMTQFVLVSDLRVASWCNELSDSFAVCFAPSDRSKCPRAVVLMILDTLRTTAAVPAIVASESGSRSDKITVLPGCGLCARLRSEPRNLE